MKPNLPLPQIAAAAFLLLAATPQSKAQQVILQADFNGSGGGTGGTSDLVTFGGTGALLSATDMTASVVNSGSLFPSEPGSLKLVESGTASAGSAAGVTLKPSSTSTSPDAWLTLGGTSTANVNGGIDFFFIDTENSGSWSNTGGAFRPIDISGGTGGMRFVINAPSTNSLEAQIYGSSSGTSIANVYATGAVSEVANHIYHLAVTATTSAAGYVTLKIFMAPGNTPIDTAANTYLVGSGTSTQVMPTGTSTITHAFNSASGFNFGQPGDNSGVDTRTLYFGSLRVYNKAPQVFPAVAYLPGLAKITPSPEPSFPANFDLFTPPFTSGTTASGTNAPAGAEWTRTGNPGDGIVISGQTLSINSGSSAGLGDDSNFAIYGQSGTALLSTRATIRTLSGATGTSNSAAAIELDPNLPNSAMYVVWPENASGTGTPLALNKAEAWWAGWNQASPGTTASVYGRNLTYGISGTLTPGLSGTSVIANGAPAADQSWVYLVGGGTYYQATVTAANPYKVDFTVPGVTTGVSYQVWVHNGHGGHYGWSMSPGLITPSTPYAWSATYSSGTLTGNYLNVTSYGASGTKTTDQGPYIENALKAAASGTTYNTVFIPTGTYYVTSGIPVPSNVQIVGNGTSTKLIPAATGEVLFRLTDTVRNIFTGSSSNVWIANMALDSGTFENNYLINGPASNSSSPGQSTRLTDLTLTGTDTTSGWFPTSTTIATQTGSGSDIVTVSSTSGVQVSGTVSGTAIGIPAGAVVTAISGSQVTLSVAAIATGSGNAVYSGSTSKTIGLSQGLLYIPTSNNLFIRNCTITGQGFDTQLANQEFLDGVTMNCMYGIPFAMELDAGPNNVSIINSTGQSYYLTAGGAWSGTAYGMGWGFVKQNNDGGAAGNIYMGNNTIDLFPPSITTNWGQQIDMEGNPGLFYGTPTSVSGTTMVFNTGSMTAQSFLASGTWEYQTGQLVPVYNLSLYATIIHGTGLGQTRRVTSMGYTGSGATAQFTGTFTVDSPWNVPPDTSTSSVVLGMYIDHETFYGNSFQGSSIDTPAGVSSWSDCGILCYGGMEDMVVDSNSFSQLQQGMVAEIPQGPRATTGAVANYMGPDFFHLIINNTGTACQEGLFEAVSSMSTDPVPATYSLAHVYRNNSIQNSTFSGFTACGIGTQPSTVPPRVDMILVDSGTFTGNPAGAFFGYPQGGISSQSNKYQGAGLGNTIFTRNTFNYLTSAATVPTDPASIPDPQGYGMYWPSGTDTPSPNIVLNNNTYHYDGTYSGTGGSYDGSNYTAATPGSALELPLRTFSESGVIVTGTSGTSAPTVTDSINVLNNGAESLTWTATSSASWLTVSPAGGTVSNENGSSAVNFSCNPAGVASGTYTGTITFVNTSGSYASSGTKTATVTFVVSSGSNP